MRSFNYDKTPSSMRRVAKNEAIDIGLRDSMHVMSETIAQLNERIEFLEARELLHRSRPNVSLLLPTE